TSAFSVSAARSTGCQSRSLPLRLPPAVRTASMMTAVPMCVLPLSSSFLWPGIDRWVKSAHPTRMCPTRGVRDLGGSPSGTKGDAMAWASIEEVDRAVAGQTVPRMFLKTVAAHGDAVALRCMDDAGGWKEWTFNDYRDQVARAAAALRGLGLEAGDKVVMMMRNRPDFHWLDTAAQFLRITPVSIYNSSSIEE